MKFTSVYESSAGLCKLFSLWQYLTVLQHSWPFNSSLTGLCWNEGKFLRDRGRASGGGLETEAVNWSFSFMCWLSCRKKGNKKRSCKHVFSYTLNQWGRRKPTVIMNCFYDFYSNLTFTCFTVEVLVQYLVQSWFEDLESHAEGQSAPFPTVSEVTERSVTDHSSQRCVLALTTTWKQSSYISLDIMYGRLQCFRKKEHHFWC